MRYVLGISAFYHDSAAALLGDGQILAAAQEERFSRIKHDAAFPADAVRYCLREAGIGAEQLDYVCFYDKPLRKFDRLIASHLAAAPRGFAAFQRAMPVWLDEKLSLPRVIRKGLAGRYDGPLVFTEHHESHAASAFFPSPFERAAIVTCDGVGEWETTTLGLGEGRTMRLLEDIAFPHSLGLLYSAFTAFAGFKVNSGEYKLMGLAPYGEPVYADRIRKNLIDLRPDGSYRLNMDYFTYVAGRTMTGDRFARLFGGPGRKPEEPITRRETDLAASIQQVIEEAMLGIAARAHAITKARDLCMAGGVALNCVANGRLHRESPFERIWIQPAAGDAGGSLGAALFVWHQLLENPRTPREQDSQKGSLLGPSYDDDAIAAALRAAQTTAAHFPDEGALLARVAELLDQGMVVGWFHGRAEFGPRALGARSILGDARSAELRSTLNLKIKGRESFRPFAPCVLRERAHELFEVEPDADCPYMLRVASVRPALRLTADAEDGLAQDLDARARVARSTIPAVTHVDFSARVQTVDAERHGRFYRLLKAFERRTGCPALINTSLNVRGEPIVGTPAQALDCFLCTDMDAIVLGDHLVTKDARSRARAAERRQEHLAQFQPD